MSGLGFYRDADGNKSWGRAAGTFCLICAAGSAYSALFIVAPASAPIAISAMSSFLIAAGAFYGTSKGQQTFSDAAAQLGKWLNGKASPTPTVTEEEK